MTDDLRNQSLGGLVKQMIEISVNHNIELSNLERGVDRFRFISDYASTRNSMKTTYEKNMGRYLAELNRREELYKRGSNDGS
jgi:hypothetical protein